MSANVATRFATTRTIAATPKSCGVRRCARTIAMTTRETRIVPSEKNFQRRPPRIRDESSWTSGSARLIVVELASPAVGAVTATGDGVTPKDDTFLGGGPPEPFRRFVA
jgi:hypothetical protein